MEWYLPSPWCHILPAEHVVADKHQEAPANGPLLHLLLAEDVGGGPSFTSGLSLST